MKHLLRIALIFVAAAGLSACSGSADPLDRTDGTANQERVRELTVEQRLLTIPEVKAESDKWIATYRSGEMTREEAAREFRLWLEEWIEDNPEQAASVMGNDPTRRAPQ